MKLSPSITRVRLIDMEGRVRFDSQDLKIKEIEELEIVGADLLEKVRKPEPTYIYEKGKILKEIVYPYIDEWERHEYSLLYSVSYAHMEEEIKQAMIRSLFLTLILAIFSIALANFLTLRIMGPISELEKGVRIIGKGNLDYTLKIKTGDELEKLAEEFNKITEKLKDSMRELEEIRASLELKVAERTKEIREKMGELKLKTEELEIKTKELENSRRALMNISEDAEAARIEAIEERDKTLAIIQNFADGLMVLDKEGKVLLVNPMFEQLLKIKRSEIEGKSIKDLRERAFLKKAIDIIFKREKIVKVKREEFSPFPEKTYELTTVPLIREKEKIGHLAIFHDISREKLIEKMKTEFVSFSAHQLRTPLSAIKWSLKMFLDGDLGKITKEQKSFISKTYEANEKMIELINDLLDVTRIEEGRYIFKPEFLQLEEIIQKVVKSLKGEIEKKEIKFKLEKPKEKLPKIKMDEEKIALAFQNLLENAIIYTPRGGKVKVSIKKLKNEVEISVKDNGIGIPKGQQKRVFSKFFRASNAMKMETRGTGLGLYITKNIIEAHGGKIWFESEEGRGSTFYFRLPIKG
jgi:PAS domain S-box-containing protein